MAADKVCATPCPNCDRKGLPILFTRYAVAYSAQKANMAVLKQLSPTSQLQAKPGGVDMHTALYNVRMLRAGYLYVHIDRGPSICTEDEWKGYVVHPQGYLNEFDVFLPGKVEPKIACARDARQANNSMVWVRDAKRVKKLWYLFNPDPIDYEHLKNVIAPNPGKYMQSFDVAAWANGNTSQKDTMQPGVLNGQVAEFAALANSKLQDALDPLLYGLMGSTAKERGWGDYEEEVSYPQLSPDGFATGFDETTTIKRVGPTYEKAHGARLKQMADFLQKNKGAVVACEDAFGITQELGHLQGEAQITYTAWQAASCPGFDKSVSNEWVYQTAIGAQGLRDLIKKGAIQKANQHIDTWNQMRRPAPIVYRDAATRAKEEARRNETIARNQQAERDQATQTGDAEFVELFDTAGAERVVDAQDKAMGATQLIQEAIGRDQVVWLDSDLFKRSINLYSTKDARVDLPGGGAALSLELAHCMGGTESNRAGKKWLAKLDLWEDNVLGKTLSFNSENYRGKMKGETESPSSPASLPNAEPTTSLADAVTDKLKPFAARASLGDKALGFIEAFPPISESGALRKLAWPLHIASLMSVKMMQTVQGLPVPKVEAKLTKYLVSLGLTTLGRTAAQYAGALSQANRDRLRNAQRGLSNAASKVDAFKAAPNARAAALAGLLDVSFAVLKGSQFQTKLDARTGVELVGNILQGIGSLADWRAKAYEETVFKGVRGRNLFTAPGMQMTLDELQALQLRGLRMTAFKFLLPAAIISAFWDGMDAWASRQRGQNVLMAAQVASVVGTVFTVASTGLAVFAVGNSSLLAAAAVLGLIGAVLTVVAVIVVLLLKESEWVIWLRDNPLNLKRKGKRPIHKNLGDTLQGLANAQAAI
ncbi:T6SS effector BTH_I2691 family protein [Ralstonia solanacearum]|uniref:T6SS effector BTH_I2691 family protein n=1 Tax=Ralstonia solanacearum TaxID=305 RepID=UPI00078D351E|nr:T6SS effector BTH_I2691 family protein [Ralstonia solanacearum]AMP39720.1 hypothetical protein LBM2029_19195 [Ralstonia solanacearum]AXV88565.1 hypothetical protein CJO78_19770 [Ralstonia solanacearum]AXW08039.1 hypothetical protein CJO82_19430 [Ralstonia solanacearum]AXW25830.1 hypothetical protein CJO86_19685 [Ralstonia solanacearum]AXW82740.1 hypothetical protein CJO98_19790 [Ralstonia solanacearum]